jgi:uncharacterized membrane protein YcaP (DUF421 family)
MFFDTWTGLARVLIVGTLAYAALVFFLRISGKRTLTKLNAFDLVVTVALGSTLATVLLSKDVALAEGLLALGLLVSLQYVATWLSVRVSWFQKLIKSEPTLVLHNGHFLDDAMRSVRLTDVEVLAVLRSQGISDVGAVAAVVLETDGSVSVLQSYSASDEAPTLRTVRTPAEVAVGR